MITADWKQNVLRPLLSGNRPDHPSEPVYVLGADVNKAQRFVFESSRLPDIRGASRILSTLNDPRFESIKATQGKTTAELLAQSGLSVGEVIYMGGGGLLALFDTAEAAEFFAQQLSQSYPEVTGVVTTTVVYIEASAGEVAQSFDRVMERLQNAMEQAKASQEVFPFFERLPFMRTCASCETRPAVTVDISPNVDHALCHLCARKSKYDPNAFDTPPGWGGRRRSFWNDALFGDGEYSAFPKDLDDLGSFSGNEIALLYADGDGVGDWIFSAKSPAEYQRRSKAISQAIEGALVTSLEKLGWRKVINARPGKTDDERRPYIRPFEIVTVGGDDVLIFLPACDAPTVAADLIEHFSVNVENKEISLSVGIAFGRSSTPVRQLLDIATDALKKGAKRQRYQHKREGKPLQGYLDFHDLTREGLPFPSLENYRSQRQYNYKNGSISYRTTQRPYPIRDFRRMLDQVNNLMLPTSQLHLLAGEIDTGFERSTLFYLYQRARLKKEKLPSLIELEEAFGVNIGAKNTVFPWFFETVNDYYTPFKDLILLRYLTKGDVNNASSDH